MNKKLVLVFIIFMLVLTFEITKVHTIGNSDTVITKYVKDVTGDGKKDVIHLIGTRFEARSLFFKNIFLKVNASNGKEYTVSFEGGYKPFIKFKDINNDKVKDIFVSVATGGSGGLSNFYLYTLKDFKLKNLTVPPTLTISSQFKDQFQASLTIENTKQSNVFNLKKRKKDYERLGLYQDGKLNEPTELLIFPYSTLEPIKVNGNKYGLKGIQRFSGAYSADTIGFIKSIWLFKNEQWVLLEASVKSPLKYKNK